MIKSATEAGAIPTFHYMDEIEVDGLLAARALLKDDSTLSGEHNHSTHNTLACIYGLMTVSALAFLQILSSARPPLPSLPPACGRAVCCCSSRRSRFMASCSSCLIKTHSWDYAQHVGMCLHSHSHCHVLEFQQSVIIMPVCRFLSLPQVPS